MGYQFSIWRRSPHADAWGVLATPKALEMHGAGDDPQQNPACLKCHTVVAKETLDEGVGCEACHGPGSEYMKDAVMRDPKAARAAGFAKSGRRPACPATTRTAIRISTRRRR